MKRILLVDDDAFFRAMFAGMLPWDTLGYSLLQAENGQEGIAMLHRWSDIVMVFTDMSMPVMDGIGLLGYITEHFPAMHCVALSAYDDFEYVKSSFKSGVGDYLLKHTLTRQQIMEVLDKYSSVRPSAPQHSADADQRARFLYDFVRGSYPDPKENQRLFQVLGLPPLQQNLVLCVLMGDSEKGVIQFPGPSDRADIRLRTALSILQSLVDRTGQGAVFQGPTDRLLYVLLTASGFENLNFARQSAAVFATQAEAAMERYFNLKTTCHCSALCRGADALQEAYRQILQAAGLQAEIASPQSSAPALPLPGVQDMQDALCFGSEQEIHQLIGEGFQYGRRLDCGDGDFARYSLRCLALIPDIAGRLPCQVPADLPDEKALLAAGADAAQEELVDQAFLRFQAQAASALRAQYTPLVYSALCIMHRELGDVNLSLNRIAAELHANAAYVSRLFKAQTGQNPSDYLIDQRLAKACRLLKKENASVRDVAAQCGFENYNYFFTVFKKHKGITPKEYRTQVMPGQPE